MGLFDSNLTACLYFVFSDKALDFEVKKATIAKSDCESLSLKTTSYFNIFHSKFYTFKRVEKTLKFSW